MQNTFWDLAAVSKEFTDPFYLAQLAPYINANSAIMEYGCGYGRILNLLNQNGYQNAHGFDFSQAMIGRGKKQYPHLNLQLINHASVPLQDKSVDLAILSTVLCCVPEDVLQKEIIQEIYRAMKPGAVLYLTDFLITDTAHMIHKYQKYFAAYKEWGIYQTTEGAIVRHFNESHIKNLLKNFSACWYKEENFVTMNNNPVKTFHGIYRVSTT